MDIYFTNGLKHSTHNGKTPSYTQCFNSGCTQKNSNWWMTWNDTEALLSSDSHIAWSIPQSGVSTDDFIDQPKVINGASDVIAAVFGDAGMHTRAAVSTNSLPLGVSVEVDAIFELN